jgi:hypothetical protein
MHFLNYHIVACNKFNYYLSIKIDNEERVWEDACSGDFEYSLLEMEK